MVLPAVVEMDEERAAGLCRRLDLVISTHPFLAPSSHTFPTPPYMHCLYSCNTGICSCSCFLRLPTTLRSLFLEQASASVMTCGRVALFEPLSDLFLTVPLCSSRSQRVSSNFRIPHKYQKCSTSSRSITRCAYAIANRSHF